MEPSIDEVGETFRGNAGTRHSSSSGTAASRTAGSTAGARDAAIREADSCIAGGPTTDMDHRGVLSDIEFPELFEAFHEVDLFVRRNPWPMLALGFVAGYWLSRSKVR